MVNVFSPWFLDEIDLLGKASMPSQLPLLHVNFGKLCPCSWWKLISFWLVVIWKIISECQSLVWVLLSCPQYCDVLICFASFPFYHVWCLIGCLLIFILGVSALLLGQRRWTIGAGPPMVNLKMVAVNSFACFVPAQSPSAWRTSAASFHFLVPRAGGRWADAEDD